MLKPACLLILIALQGIDARDRAIGADSLNPTPEITTPHPAGKSLFAAHAWSLLGSLIPVSVGFALPDPNGDAGAITKAGLIYGGFLVGPSLGQFYAGSYARGALAVGVRTLGAAMGLVGYGQVNSDCETCNKTEGAVLLGVGALTYLGGAVYSLYDNGKGVERRNAKLSSPTALGWTPILSLRPDGSLMPGVLAWMRF